MGDIPDRSLFRHVILEKALTAYFDIVKGKKIGLPYSTAPDWQIPFQPAVRTGSLSQF